MWGKRMYIHVTNTIEFSTGYIHVVYILASFLHESATFLQILASFLINSAIFLHNFLHNYTIFLPINLTRNFDDFLAGVTKSFQMLLLVSQTTSECRAETNAEEATPWGEGEQNQKSSAERREQNKGQRRRGAEAQRRWGAEAQRLKQAELSAELRKWKTTGISWEERYYIETRLEECAWWQSSSARNQRAAHTSSSRAQVQNTAYAAHGKRAAHTVWATKQRPPTLYSTKQLTIQCHMMLYLYVYVVGI